MNGQTFTHNGLTANTQYIYRACAPNNGIKVCSDDGASATTQAQAAATPPSGLKPFNITTTSLGISWTDNSSAETGFRIELKVNGVFNPAGTTAANSNAFTLTGLQPNTTYELRICALTAAGAACSESALVKTKSN